jgi:hypothetical protein
LALVRRPPLPMRRDIGGCRAWCARHRA